MNLMGRNTESIESIPEIIGVLKNHLQTRSSNELIACFMRHDKSDHNVFQILKKRSQSFMRFENLHTDYVSQDAIQQYIKSVTDTYSVMYPQKLEKCLSAYGTPTKDNIGILKQFHKEIIGLDTEISLGVHEVNNQDNRIHQFHRYGIFVDGYFSSGYKRATLTFERLIKEINLIDLNMERSFLIPSPSDIKIISSFGEREVGGYPLCMSVLTDYRYWYKSKEEQVDYYKYRSGKYESDLHLRKRVKKGVVDMVNSFREDTQLVFGVGHEHAIMHLIDERNYLDKKITNGSLSAFSIDKKTGHVKKTLFVGEFSGSQCTDYNGQGFLQRVNSSFTS